MSIHLKHLHRDIFFKGRGQQKRGCKSATGTTQCSSQPWPIWLPRFFEWEMTSSPYSTWHENMWIVCLHVYTCEVVHLCYMTWNTQVPFNIIAQSIFISKLPKAHAANCHGNSKTCGAHRSRFFPETARKWFRIPEKFPPFGCKKTL